MDNEELGRLLQETKTLFCRGRSRLALAERQIAALGVDERYPAVPRESWQDRGGDSRYLYMLFQESGEGYGGPGGRRKLYVGNKPEKIAEARRLAANSRRYRTLLRRRYSLRRWLRMQAIRLRRWLENALAEEPADDLEGAQY